MCFLCFALFCNLCSCTDFDSFISINNWAWAFCSQASWCTCRGGLNVDAFG